MSSPTIATSITWSDSLRVIHFTPEAHLPIGRTSSSLNWIAFPSFVARNTQSVPEVVFTQRRSSSSFTQQTLSQFARIFFIISILSFFTIHLRETKNRYLFFSRVISRIADISSSFCKLSRFTIGCPFAPREVSGISYAGSVNTLHFVVKKSKSLWFFVGTICWISSSSFAQVVTHLPPLFCVRKLFPLSLFT